MRVGLALGALIFLAGCGGASKSQNSIAGNWIYRDPKVKNVPDALIYRLRILPDGSFLMGGGIAPIIVGKATLKGETVTLTPRKVPGVTDQPEGPQGPDPLKPIEGTFPANGETLTITEPGTKALQKFVRQIPETQGEKSVTKAEETYVGRYAADVDWTKVEAASKPMLQAIQPFFMAELQADNTFLLDVAFPMKGKWKVVEGKNRVKFTFTEGGQSVEMDAKNGVLSTPETEAVKSPYFFKKVGP